MTYLNLTAAVLLVMVLMTGLANAQNTQNATGVEIDVNTINRQLTPTELIEKIEQTMSHANEYIGNVAQSTDAMVENLSLSKQVVATCELRNKNSITGAFSQQAYIYSCSNALVQLKETSAKYAKITDELTAFLPVANKLIEDGVLSKEQLLLVVQAEKAQKTMVEVIDNTNSAKKALNDVL